MDEGDFRMLPYLRGHHYDSQEVGMGKPIDELMAELDHDNEAVKGLTRLLGRMCDCINDQELRIKALEGNQSTTRIPSYTAAQLATGEHLTD